MNQALESAFVEAIGSVRRRIDTRGSWAKWADAVLAGAKTTASAVKAIEAAAEAASWAQMEPSPVMTPVARAAYAVAHAAALAAFYGDRAAVVVQWTIDTVEQEL